MTILGGLLAILLALAGLFGCGALTAMQESGGMDMPPQVEMPPQIEVQPSVPEQPKATFRSDVIVLGVEARVLDSLPPQIELDVTGYNPDGCEYPVVTEVMQDGGNISVYLYREIPISVMCPAVVVDYQATIPLGAFESGTYSISVNGFVVEVTI